MENDELIGEHRTPVSFQFLGPFRAMRGTVEIELGAPRERRLLIALLRSAGHWISRDELVTWVWDVPPTHPRALDEVAGFLRNGSLAELGLSDQFTSRDGRCRLDVDSDCVDAHRLKRLAARADEVRGVAHRDLLRAALGLRHGEPLEDIGGQRIDAYRGELTARYRRVEILYNQLEVRTGRGATRLQDLERLHEQDPVDVLTAGLYMCALYLAGNPTRADAVRGAHVEQLFEYGLEVPRQLADLQQAMLSGASDLGVAGAYFLGGPFRPINDADPDAEVPPESEELPTTAQDRVAAIHSTVTTNNGVVNAIGSITTDYLNLGIDKRRSG